MTCTLCGSDCGESFLSLGHQPPSDAFLRTEDLQKSEVSYPLDLHFCPKCTLVQLGYAVDPDILFRDYVYTTGTNNALRANFKALVDLLVEKYTLTDKDLAVDVGSNDGTLLENYLPRGVKILGIDPSSSAKIAQDKGLPTIIDYFNAETAAHAVKEYGHAKVITAANVFAHVPIDPFMKGIDALLAPDGVFVSESGYVVSMIEGMQYDSIYHEHLRYYSVTSLVALFKKYGMEVVDVEHIESHGGSLRVTAARPGSVEANDSVAAFLKKEKDAGYTERAVYQNFAKKVQETKFALLSIIYELKKSGARIAGIGAPAKGNTLLNYCKLDSDLIEYLTERSEIKIGRYSPGMHIPVVPDAKLIEEQPEAAILLSWNIADELIPKIKNGGYKGKIIVPNPVPRVV